MSINLANLSATELDELIANAAELRGKMEPTTPGERPQTVQASINPAWFVAPIQEGTLFQIWHPVFNWLAFVIPPPERAQLLALLLQQAVLPAPQSQSSVSAAAAPTSGSGGKLH